MNKIPLIIIAGPTASGKTSLAICLAQKFDGEIVSADSMQIYKNISIGTAKPNLTQRNGIPHHMLDIADLSDEFSVALYVEKAKEIIADIYKRGKLPIIAGGTGLYINSLVDNVKFDDTQIDILRRQELIEYADRNGNESLLERLRKIDPDAAKKLHPNNLKRIVRAIELYEDTGKTKEEQNKNSKLEISPYNDLWFGLTFKDREKLYDRINERVDMMFESGLVDESKGFFMQNPCQTALQAIGYKELKPYLDGTKTLEEVTETLKIQTRRYAKRQLTWFRKNDKINWLYCDEMCKKDIFDKTVLIIQNFLKGENL